jgi:hypothetical protein
MKTTILAFLFCCATALQSLSADEPIIPTSLNAVLPKIHAGMTIHEVEQVLSASYPKVAGHMSEWDGMTGYIDYRLDDRYSLSVASINRMDGQKVFQVVGGGDQFFYIFDWQAKHRIEIKQYDWEQHFISGDIPLKQVVAQSQVIVYATADTNNLPNVRYTIVEVLKGSHDASVAGIASGMQISRQWPANGGTLPEGAVLFYQRIPDSAKLEIRNEYMVRGGQVAGMTIQQFKNTFGL